MQAREFSLRKANREDANKIRGMVRAENLNPLSLDWRHFLVACNQDGEVIGCGQVKAHKDGSRELASMVVLSGWRGKGAARALIEGLINTHPGTLYLTCMARLQPLYEKFGFKVIAFEEMPPYFKRISRLISIMVILAPKEFHLRVMRREASQGISEGG